MTERNFTEKLDKILSKETSGWAKRAQWREDNKSWLKFSRKVAIKVNSILRKGKITKNELAREMNEDITTVNAIVKGKEKLTPELIAKLEDILSIQLSPKTVQTDQHKFEYDIKAEQQMVALASYTYFMKCSGVVNFSQS